MKNLKPLLILLFILVTLSCKKETKIVLSSNNRLVDFKVSGQTVESTIDYDSFRINVVIPYSMPKTKLDYSFVVSKEAIVSLNNVPQNVSNGSADFSSSKTLTILAPNGDMKTWTITVSTDMEVYGLGAYVSASKSVDVPYNWYYDQALTGQFSSINCGPASVTMAIKWADESFAKTPEEARATYRPQGGWWYTSDIANYLNKYDITYAYTTLPDKYETIKKFIDKDNLVILCLDNYYITYNINNVHIDRYYKVNAPSTGHFIVVKGYKEVDSKIYWEVYDPWSYNAKYAKIDQLKGKDRYYRAEDIENATNIWWDFGIVVAKKGRVITFSKSNANTEVLEALIPVQKGY